MIEDPSALAIISSSNGDEGGSGGGGTGSEETAEQLQRHLQKAQRTNAELLAELDSVQRALARLRSERKYTSDGFTI